MSIVEAFEQAELVTQHQIAQQAKANLNTLLTAHILSKELTRDLEYILNTHRTAYELSILQD